MDHGPIARAGVAEFAAALLARHTYAPRENPYLWFGFLWGLPVPVVTLAMDLILAGRPPSDALRCMAEHPVHLFFLVHPFLFAIVFGALGTMAYARDERIRDLVGRLSGEARTDGLTGLLNHRAFYEALQAEVGRSKRQGSPLACLFLDVDHFKLVNDRWGHRTGDRVLAGLAERLRRASRPYDVVARYGGEEIAMLLPGAAVEEARAHAERLRQAVEAAPFDAGPDTPPIRATVSVGVAVLGIHAIDGPRLVEAVDRALYDSKRAGRNRVTVSNAAATRRIHLTPPA